ncbi:MAG: hypothetical protein JNL98_03435 [Bryobacterales bacterium]|nr:hypothetical protein [Bryobacterales bacterium]
MGVGKFIYQISNKFRHGLRAAYYRDHVRPRILETAPIPDTTDRLCEIHVLTSKDDWLNLIWTLKTFYHYSGRRYRLAIHDDGTLPPEAVAHLRRHFPGATLIRRAEADARAAQMLGAWPRCLEFRGRNTLSLKVFDFLASLTTDRMLLLDSDILFFDTPAELLRRIEDPAYRRNTVNADIDTAYTVDIETARREYGIDLIERFNSGLGLIHKASLRLDWIEELLTYSGIHGHFWRIEQTIFALLSSRYGVELLPETYRVNLGKGLRGLPCRHYVGAIRHLMYAEGMRDLAGQQFFQELRAA